MSDISLKLDAEADAGGATAGDYFQLLKPRVMSLVVLTALAGLAIAPGVVHPVIGLASILAIAVGAGASGALNMWWDADIDRVMSRTSKRPIPSGRVSADEALTFGMILSVGSVIVLGLVANWVAAAFLAFTIFFYVVVYTMGLKRWTAQNIVIGGAAGAFPPMIGWAVATGGFSWESFVLFAIIFVWTPPHFWALALGKADEYRRAGVPMLPVVAGDAATRFQILAYTALLAPLGLLPVFMGFAHWIYAIIAAIGGIWMLVLAWQVYARPDDKILPKKLFGVSIFYLFGVFLALLLETSIWGA